MKIKKTSFIVHLSMTEILMEYFSFYYNYYQDQRDAATIIHRKHRERHH